MKTPPLFSRFDSCFYRTRSKKHTQPIIVMKFPNKANSDQSEQRKGLPPRRHHRPDQEEKKDGSSPILAPRKPAIDDSRSIVSSSTTESSTALLLDQQIAGQRQMGIQATDRAVKQQAKAARAAAATQRKLPPPPSMATASQSDRSAQDALAKSRGRRSTNGSSTKFQKQRPLPAHSRSSTLSDSIKRESNNATKLQRLEEEVAAKSRGKAAATGTKRSPLVLSSNSSSNSSLGSSFTAVKRMNRMEADIAAKERTRAGRGAGIHRAIANSANGGTPTNRMDRLEADAAAKAQAKASRTAGTINGKNKNREDAIARKFAKSSVTQTTPAVVPGAVSSNEAADGVATKSILKKKNGIAASAVSDSKVAKSKIASPAAHVVGGGKQDKLRKKDLPSGGSSGLVDIELTEIMNGEGNKGENNKGLAVAVAVTDDDNENVFIPSAIEFDPDAKLPMYKNQRFRVYGLLGCTLMIILTACAIGVLAILQREQRMRDMFPPTDSPTCARCTIDFIEQLELEVGSQVLNDPTSPEYMAKEWIIHQDPAQLEANDRSFVQRFLMAAFYFDTHQQADWLSCNEANYAANETDDCDFMKIHRIEPTLEYDPCEYFIATVSVVPGALLLVGASLTYYSKFSPKYVLLSSFIDAILTDPAKRWLSSLHECEWAGVGCDELKQIRMIDLPGQRILGTFPATFKHLRYIQVVALQLNNFTGTLPDSFGQMKHLIHIEFHGNKFTGSIPNSWSNARNLQLLNIAGNQLSGGIPSSIGNFRNIKGIFAYKSNLTGTLPPELSNAKSLGKFVVCNIKHYETSILSFFVCP